MLENVLIIGSENDIRFKPQIINKLMSDVIKDIHLDGTYGFQHISEILPHIIPDAILVDTDSEKYTDKLIQELSFNYSSSIIFSIFKDSSKKISLQYWKSLGGHRILDSYVLYNSPQRILEIMIGEFGYKEG